MISQQSPAIHDKILVFSLIATKIKQDKLNLKLLSNFEIKKKKKIPQIVKQSKYILLAFQQRKAQIIGSILIFTP